MDPQTERLTHLTRQEAAIFEVERRIEQYRRRRLWHRVGYVALGVFLCHVVGWLVSMGIH